MSSFLRNRLNIYTRRSLILSGFKGLMMLILAERLYKLQIKEGYRFRKLAEENRINSRLIIPPRGRIFDRSSSVLAMNKENFRLILIPSESRDPINTVSKISNLIHLTEEEIKNFNNLFITANKNIPIYLRQNLIWNDVAKISEHIPELSGVFKEKGLVRHYKSMPSAKIVGNVGKQDKNDQKKSTLLSMPGSRIGKSGVELAYDKEIRGKPGTQKVEVNAHGRVIKELVTLGGMPGSDIHLTILGVLQEYISNKLLANSAAVVVMKVPEGDIISMVSTPTFDPNMFSSELSTRDWENIRNNPDNPLFNRASMGLYPPGSVFKLVVLLAALESGILDPDKKHFCSGGFEFGNQTFHCWKEHGHGFVDAKQALSQSCDVFFYELSLRIGIDTIMPMARKLGLGYAYEKKVLKSVNGLLPDKKWKLDKLNQKWSKSETIVTGIGQGYILTSPLQLAVMTSRIASGGKLIYPKLIKSINNNSTKIKNIKNLNLSKSSIDLVKSAMYDSVNEIRGTAYNSRILSKKNIMAGKTGTSQVRRISMLEREQGVVKNEELPLDQRDHALFVGFAPYTDPKYAISVVIEHGGSGSRSAAPIARDIFLQLFSTAIT